MDNLKMAACGIDCNECELYKAEFDVKAAKALVEWFRDCGWIEQNDNAEAVMKKAPFCKGCWNKTGVHWSDGNCSLLVCCEEKQLNHCGECNDFPCKNYTEFANDGLENHKKAMEHLLSLRANHKG